MSYVIKFNHNHNYIYGDNPRLGECECGDYRVWDKESKTYVDYERQGE